MLVPTLNARWKMSSCLHCCAVRATVQSRDQARELLTQLGLGERLLHLPAQLSGGEQQRVALARAFSGRPGLLFADESLGIWIVKRASVLSICCFSLNRDFATTLILVTHDEQLAARCNRRLRLRDGKLWEEQ
ncbi:ATP-binding cassette domain-containing protein [Pantoea ananatis]